VAVAFDFRLPLGRVRMLHYQAYPSLRFGI